MIPSLTSQPCSLVVLSSQEEIDSKSKIEDLSSQFEHHNSLLLEKLQAFKQRSREVVEQTKKPPQEGEIKAQEESSDPLNGILHGFGDVANSLLALGQQDEADHLMTYGSSACKLLKAYQRLENRSSDHRVLFGEIASASSALSTLSFQTIPTNVPFLRKFYQAYGDLFTQISVIHSDMVKGFSFLKDQVDVLHLNIMRGFLFLDKQIQQVAIPVFYSISKIESDLKQLQAINAKIDVVLLFDFTKSCNFVESYQDRSGSQLVEKGDFEFHARSLENVLLGVAPPFYTFNGSLCEDYQPSAVVRTVRSARADAIIGFLVSYAEKVLKIPFPAPFPASSIPNFSIFSLGLDRYHTLRKMGANIEFDVQGILLKKILETGSRVLLAIQHIQSNALIFEKLFTSYQQKLAKVQGLCQRVLDNFSDEVFERLVDQAAKVNSSLISSTQKCNSGNIRAYINWSTYHRQQWQEYLFSHCEKRPKFNYINRVEKFLNQIVGIGQNWDASYTKELTEISTKEKVSKQVHRVEILTPLKDLIARVNPNPVINFCNPEKEQVFPVKHPQMFIDKALKFIPLTLSSLAGDPKKAIQDIPAECFLAEQLGLGQLEYCYNVTSTPYDGDVDFLPVTFTVTVAFKILQSQTSLTINKFSFNGTPINSENSSYDSFWWTREITFRDRGAVMLKQCWNKGTNFTPDQTVRGAEAQNREVLSKLIQESLVNYRKQGLAILYKESTPLNIEYMTCLEELQADYLLLQAFGEIAGFNESEMKELSSLPSGEAIKRLQLNYLKEPKSESDPFFPIFAPVEMTSRRILERFPKEYQVESEIVKNPIATIFQNQLSSLARFGLSFIEGHVSKKKGSQSSIASSERQLGAPSVESLIDKIKEIQEKYTTLQSESSEREQKLERTVSTLASRVKEMEALNGLLLEKVMSLSKLMEASLAKKDKAAGKD